MGTSSRLLVALALLSVAHRAAAGQAASRGQRQGVLDETDTLRDGAGASAALGAASAADAAAVAEGDADAAMDAMLAAIKGGSVFDAVDLVGDLAAGRVSLTPPPSPPPVPTAAQVGNASLIHAPATPAPAAAAADVAAAAAAAAPALRKRARRAALRRPAASVTAAVAPAAPAAPSVALTMFGAGAGAGAAGEQAPAPTEAAPRFASAYSRLNLRAAAGVAAGVQQQLQAKLQLAQQLAAMQLETVKRQLAVALPVCPKSNGADCSGHGSCMESVATSRFAMRFAEAAMELALEEQTAQFYDVRFAAVELDAQWLGKLAAGAASAVTKVASAVTSAVSGGASKAVAALGSLASSAVSAVGSAASSLASAASAGIAKVVDAAKSLGSAVVEKVSQVASSVKGAFSGLSGSVLGGLGALAGAAGLAGLAGLASSSLSLSSIMPRSTPPIPGVCRCDTGFAGDACEVDLNGGCSSIDPLCGRPAPPKIAPCFGNSDDYPLDSPCNDPNRERVPLPIPDPPAYPDYRPAAEGNIEPLVVSTA